MPLSKKTALAQAKRQLRRIEEDEPAFRLQIADFSDEGKDAALRWFFGMLERQREYVRKLEQEQGIAQ